MTALTPTVNASAATLGNNSIGRTFQDPNIADCPLFVKHFYYKNETGAALAAGTIIDFGPVLGPCKVLATSFLNTTALGAARTLELGFNDYTNQLSGATVSNDIAAFISALDVSSARTDIFGDVGVSGVYTSGKEMFGAFRLLGKVSGDTIPTNAVISGFLVLSKPL